MRAIRVGFSKPKSKWAIGSLLIRFFERTKFSHTLIRWTSNALRRDLIYHASHGMSHFISGARFDETVDTVLEYEVQLTEEQYTKVVQRCVDLAGIKYGYLQLVGMAFERITKIKNPFRDGPKTYVCSELVGEVLKQVYEIDFDLEYEGPGKLEELVSKLPGVTRIR